MYQLQTGQAIIYFNGTWKINDVNDKAGWYYEHPDSRSSLPPQGQWSTESYFNGNTDPAPTITALDTSSVGYDFVGQGNCGPGTERTFLHTDIETCRAMCSANALCTGYD